MIRLNEAQYRKVKKLTRRLCANNDGGCCLVLDDGDPCVCVQAISYSLLCRYFREAVLPADRELCADIIQTSLSVYSVILSIMRWTVSQASSKEISFA